MLFCEYGNSLYYLLSNEEPGTAVGKNCCFSSENMLCNQGCRIAFIFEDKTEDTCLL